MNILFHCSEYSPMPSGGIGSIVRIVAEEMVKRGHTIVVAGYYPFVRACEKQRIDNGVIVYEYSLGYQSTKFGRLIYTALNKVHAAGFIAKRELGYFEEKLSLLIKKYNIDILELTDHYIFNQCCSNLNFRKFDIPVIMRFHGSAYFLSLNAGMDISTVKFNDLKHFARADYFSFVSNYLESFVKDMGCDIDEKKAVVIHNMVEDDFFSENDKSCQDKTILFFGKLVRTKGAYATVQAFRKFHKTHPDWKLVMVGSGYKSDIIDGLSSENLSAILFPGFCNREQIKNYIDECSFVCLPSYFEAFGMALIEAMARSKPVIFSSRTSGPEIIDDGKDGLLVDPDDTQMICDKMALLADNPDLRKRLSENAFQKVHNCFCASGLFDDFENFYKSIVK